MKQKMIFRFLALLSLVVIFAMTSCKKEQGPIAAVNVLATSGYKSGDVIGNGGSASRTFKFINSSTTAGWDMSMDATSGSFRLILKDATGAVKVDKILVAGIGDQSADGTSPAGTAGEWTATVTLTNFNGSGDYSFN